MLICMKSERVKKENEREKEVIKVCWWLSYTTVVKGAGADSILNSYTWHGCRFFLVQTILFHQSLVVHLLDHCCLSYDSA